MQIRFIDDEEHDVAPQMGVPQILGLSAEAFFNYYFVVFPLDLRSRRSPDPRISESPDLQQCLAYPTVHREPWQEHYSNKQ